MLFDYRFFITSSVLDLTIVGLDSVEGDSSSQGQQQHPHYLKTCSKPSLDLGSVVYLLGYSAEKEELTVGEGKVVIATDNLIKLSADGEIWSPGSAGFDVQGNLAFMVCDPMKLATSPPTNRSSSTTTTTTTLSSSSSWKKDCPTQFGIPIPVVIDWLNQHWEGSLDELNKPKMPIIRLMSSGQRSEHSCASFTLRRVFKPTEPDHHRETNPEPNTAEEPKEDEAQTAEPRTTHAQGIPTPEIYESPKVNSVPVRKKPATSPVQLLDINFPPKMSRPASQHHPVKYLYPSSGENFTTKEPRPDRDDAAEASSTGSVNGAHSEVRSSASPVEIHSEEEERETMYSAETAESRNYTSPRESRFQQQVVGRSQSCVGHHRWAQKSPAARRALLENQRSFVHGRKVHSQGATSQRSNDYYSPTVSSIMKKRIGSEQQPMISKPRQSAVVHSSPKWNF